MKLFRYVAIGVAALLVILVVAAVVLMFVFDPNDYKGTVQRVARERTGRELALPGAIKLRFFPDIALEFGPATLGNAAGFGTEPMLTLERVRLGVRLRPLFSRRVEVSSVEVLHPVIRLQVDKAGHDNWSDIQTQLQQSAAPANTSDGAGTPLSVQIESLLLNDGELSYRDAREAGPLSVSKLHVQTGAVTAGKPVALDLSFTFDKAGGTSLDLRLRATLTPDMDRERYQLDTPVIELLARSSGLPKEGLQVAIRSASLGVDLKQQTLEWPGLQLDAAGAKLTAEIKGRSIVDAPVFSGTITLADLSLRDLLPQFGIAVPITKDPTVLKHFSLRSNLEAGTKSVSLSGLNMQLDDSQLTGSAGIVDLDSMALRFDLQINRFNADRYLQPTPAKPTDARAAASSPPVEIPVELLRALNLRGNLRVAAATFAGVQFGNLRLGVDAGQGKVHFAPLAAQLYGGQYQGDTSIDATGIPRVSFNDQITGVDFAPLARDWLETKKLSGRGNLSVKATASGKDSNAMLRTLNGSLALKVDNGAVEGKDLLYEIRRARALLRKEPIPERTGPERTLFTQLSATGAITNGVVNTNDLVVATQVLRVNGKGSADLVGSQLDMRLDVAVLKAAERDVPADMADVAGLVVPMRITGALGDPTVRPDVEAIVKAVVQQKLDEKKKELEDKVRDQLGEKLKGLLGR